VDLQPFDPLGDPVVPLDLDVTEPDAVERVQSALGRPAHAVLSDAAPKLSGIPDVDRSAGAELCAAALAVAQRVLRPKGFLIVKDFPGPESKAFGAELRRAFARVAEIRPEGRRSTSKEFYCRPLTRASDTRSASRRTRAPSPSKLWRSSGAFCIRVDYHTLFPADSGRIG
jgi:23S rRNA (uridine2552-2'-O)-methyltransferase